MQRSGIRFAYNEPAMVMRAGGEDYLVIGDLHIGIERELSKRGVHVFSATEFMANRIKKIMKQFSLKKIIMLGDIKETILYPDTSGSLQIKGFFDQLGRFDVTIIAGNHDAHLGDIIDTPIKRELILGRFALLHGDKNPSDNAMMCDYIVTAHSHPIVRIKDTNGAIYDEKVWLMAALNKTAARKAYDNVNSGIRLIVMPAFNSLIMGTSLGRFYSESANPLIRNRIFLPRKAEIYNLAGQRIDLRSVIG